MQPATSGAIERLRREPDLYEALRGLLRAENEVRDALERGTYALSPQYGKWGTVWCPVTGMRDGASAPSWGSIAAGYLPAFVAGNVMHGVAEVPESYVEGGAWVPSVVFTFGGATTAGDLITWVVTMSTAGRAMVFVAAVAVTATFTCGAGDNSRHCVLRVPVQDLGVTPQALVSFSVSRSGSGAAVNPSLLGVRWGFQKKRFGVESEP